MRAWQALSSGWTAFAIPSNIQKRLYKFLLRKSIGRFLAQDLDFENFDVELVNGCIELRDLDLNLEVLDELISDSPFSITEGHIGGITASLPWSNFWSGDIVLEMRGLRLTLKPELNRPKKEKPQVVEEPVMSTSMHLAGDFLKTEVSPNEDEELRQSIHLSAADSPSMDFSMQQDGNLEGLQVLTKVIDKMLARIKVKVIDSVLRLHHTSNISLSSGGTSFANETHDYYLDIQIPNITYFDETPGLSDGNSREPSPPDINMQTSSILLPPAINESIKILVVTSPTVWIRSGLDLSIHSFGTASDHELGTLMKQSSLMSEQSDFEMNDSSMFHSALGESHMSGSITPQQAPRISPNTLVDSTYEALIFSTMDKENWFRFKFSAGQPAEWSSAIPDQSRLNMKQLDVLVSSICMSLSPNQVVWLSDLLETFTKSTNSSENELPAEHDTTDKSSLNDDTSDLQELLNASTPDFGTPESPIYHTPSLPQVQERKLQSDTHRQPRFDHISQQDRSVQEMNQRHSTTPRYQYAMDDWAHGRASSSMSFSTVQHQQKQSPPVKIKFSLSSANLYISMKEPPSPISPVFFSAPSPALLNTNHLKFSLNQFVLRYKDWSSLIDANTSNTKKRHSRIPGSPSSTDNVDTISCPSNALDIRISDISLHEWLIARGGDQMPLPGMSKLQFEVYNPILQFNELLPKTYRSENDFSTISLAELPQGDGKRESLRFKAETWKSKSDSPARQDIAMDIKPLLLNLDIRIVDRLEQIAVAFIGRPENPAAATHGNNQNNDRHGGNPQYTNGSDIYADLKQIPSISRVINNHSIKLPFIRIVLLTPNMSHAKAKGEATDLVHEDFFVIDIRKLCSRSTAGGDNESDFPSEGRSTFPRNAEALEDVDYLHIGPSGAFESREATDKINLQFELESANIFLKKENDVEPICWFMVKSCLESPLSPPGTTNAKKVSTFNLTICTKQDDKKDLFNPFDPSHDRNIPYAIFESLKRDLDVQDDEEKIHIPREEQSGLSARFKRYSIGSSMIAIKCDLPLTRMNLAKDTWDTVQLLQNDLILWQPRFLASMSKDQKDTSVMEHNLPERTNEQSIDGSDDDIPGTDNRGRSFVPHSMDSGVIPGSGESPTLLSIMACLQKAEWTLHYTKPNSGGVNVIHTYDAMMSNFQYFAAIKNMGQDENITTLDIDEVSLFEVQSADEAELLLERTIPAALQYVPPMVSILTKLQNNIAENIQEKSSSVIISNLQLNYNSDVSFIDNLVKFQNTPSTMNIIDPPSTFIKVYVTVDDTSIVYGPPDSTLQAAIVIDELKLATDVFPNQERLSINIQMRALDLYLTDDRGELNSVDAIARMKGYSISASRWWRNVGLARCIAMRDLKVNVSVALREEEQLALDVALTNHVLGFEVCKDSLPTIMNLVEIATASSNTQQPDNDQPTEAPDVAENLPEEASLKVQAPNMLASLDEQAFLRQSTSSTDNKNTIMSDMDYVEEYYATVPIATNRDNDSNDDNAKKDVEEMFIVPPRKPRRKNAAPPSQEDIVHVMEEEDQDSNPLVIDESHFSQDLRTAPQRPRVDVSNSVKRIRLKDFNIVCKLYDGYDWRHTRHFYSDPTGGHAPSARPYSSSSSIPQARTQLDESERPGSPLQPQPQSREEYNPMFDPSRVSYQKASSEAGYLAEDMSDTTSQYSRFHDNTSVREGKQPATHHRRSASSPDSIHPRRSPRRSKNTRSQSARLEIRLEQINVEFDLLPPTGQLVSHLHISVRDFEIIDHIKTSMYRKFLSYMRSDTHPRERGSNMIRFELTSVRPVASQTAEEHRLKFRILPMRLYIDQDAIIFLINFFSFDRKILKSKPIHTQTPSTAKRQEDNTFFQHVEVYPVILKVDYRPKHVNYSSLKDGQFVELVNFFHLDAAEMHLSHVKLTGIKGYDRLVEAVLNHWLPHIRDTQLGNVVTGVSSIQSAVNIGSGVADLVLLPIEQYKKDGRIIRGLQRGTQSFARATTMEAIKIGSRLAAGTQVILEQADDFFSPLTSKDTSDTAQEVYDSDDEPNPARQVERRLNDSDSDTQEVISKFADQPSDLSQGLQHAYHSLSKNIKSAAHTVLAVPTEIQESGGPQGTAKAVIRAVPVAVIRPLIGFSEAFANVLVGIRNTIDPGQKIQSVEKYKRG